MHPSWHVTFHVDPPIFLVLTSPTKESADLKARGAVVQLPGLTQRMKDIILSAEVTIVPDTGQQDG